MTTELDLLCKACRHLARRDIRLKALITTVGPCTLRSEPNRFASLVRAIVAQQISTLAARAITARLTAAVPRKKVTPAAILGLSDEKLRAAGLSGAKTAAVRDLALKVSEGIVPIHDFHELDNEEVIEKLLPVRGIGRWTAEMFLIFSLGRLDVLPVADFGLRAGVQRHYRLRKLPSKDRLEVLAAPWKPYRSIGTWYIWRSLGGVPQS
jgi:DNA-3-methyladenine glycosylase II